MAAVSELVERLDVIGRLDAVIGPIKQRRRGHTGGQLLVGMAAAQLAGEDFLVGLDRQRADVAGQRLAPVPGLAATTAAGLARRLSDTQWTAVETGLGDVHAGALVTLAALPAAARAARIRLRADAGYFAGQLDRAALFADIEFALGADGSPRCGGCSTA